jgi:hypothetical protein
MSEKRDIYQQALQKLYPFQPSDDAGRALDYHKLAVIFALSTRDDLLAAVFPFEGKPDHRYRHEPYPQEGHRKARALSGVVRRRAACLARVQ